MYPTQPRNRNILIHPNVEVIQPTSSVQPNNNFCTTDLQCKEKFNSSRASCKNFECVFVDDVDDVVCNTDNNCFKVFVGNSFTGQLTTKCLSYDNQDYTSESFCNDVQQINCTGRFENNICQPDNSDYTAVEIPLPFRQGSIWITLINNSAANRIQDGLSSNQRL